MTQPDPQQIEDEYNEAVARTAEGGSKYPGMSYEEGVRDALDWVLGENESPAPLTGEED